MTERLSDDAAEVERLFLWEDIVAVLRANADKLGLQTSFGLADDADNQPTRFVLAELPYDEDHSLQLWAETSSSALIAKASLLYFDSDGKEVFNYELTPTGIQQFSPEPTPLDRQDLLELRRDVNEADWDEDRSWDCAKNLVFLD